MFIGLVINLIQNVWLFNVGKFIHGVAVGFFLFFGPVYLNEFVPVHIRGVIGGSTSLFIGFGAATPFKFIELYSKNPNGGYEADPNSKLTSEKYF